MSDKNKQYTVRGSVTLEFKVLAKDSDEAQDIVANEELPDA